MGSEVEWKGWRKCPSCLAPMGTPCLSRSGRIVNGQTDNVVTVLPVPHALRKPRTIPIAGLPGYVVGLCGHRVARQEWRAGFRRCERCHQ